uniref:Uncharacterized protein n=1 Tax=Saccharum officinarum TaxID=4547 RepID=A0A678TGX3_SACOF|nr:hypothetical protein SO13M23_000011 [Saccharum officinarum]
MACCDLVAWGVWSIRPARVHQLALGGPLARARRQAEHIKPKCLTKRAMSTPGATSGSQAGAAAVSQSVMTELVEKDEDESTIIDE